MATYAPEPPCVGRVLVVDDSPANLELLERLLVREGHVVFSAPDGVEALNVLPHERLDGSGYPRAVPLLAQIVGIVDVYDALTSHRPYRSALPCERAFEELVLEAEKGWRDPALVAEFIALRKEGVLED